MSRVANRYSKALFELAVEQKKLDAVEKDLNLVQSVLDENEDFAQLMVNPLVQASVKAKVVGMVFDGKVNSLTFNFLNMVCSKKRSDSIHDIITIFKDRLNDHRGILRGEILSAIPMSDEQKDQVAEKMQQLTGKTVVLGQEIDESLLGGFVVKVRDTVIDFSVKRQLEKLREKLVFG